MNRLPRLVRDEKGVTAVEFVLVLPFILFLLMGGIEVASYVLLHNKLSRVASTTADLTTRTPDVTEEDLTQIFDAATLIGLPHRIDQTGAVVISSITADPDPSATPPIAVSWQRHLKGNNVSFSSQMGAEGGTATLPPNFVLRPTQNVIVVEVFFDYEPMLFKQVTEAKQIYHRAVVFPRAGSLSTIQAPPAS